MFRNSEFSIQKINNRLFCWLSCLVVGSTVSKPDEGLDVGPLCLLCAMFVWASARADHSYMGVLQAVSNCVLSRNLSN